MIEATIDDFIVTWKGAFPNRDEWIKRYLENHLEWYIWTPQDGDNYPYSQLVKAVRKLRDVGGCSDNQIIRLTERDPRLVLAILHDQVTSHPVYNPDSDEGIHGSILAAYEVTVGEFYDEVIGAAVKKLFPLKNGEYQRRLRAQISGDVDGRLENRSDADERVPGKFAWFWALEQCLDTLLKVWDIAAHHTADEGYSRVAQS